MVPFINVVPNASLLTTSALLFAQAWQFTVKPLKSRDTLAALTTIMAVLTVLFTRFSLSSLCLNRSISELACKRE